MRVLCLFLLLSTSVPAQHLPTVSIPDNVLNYLIEVKAVYPDVRIATKANENYIDSKLYSLTLQYEATDYALTYIIDERSIKIIMPVNDGILSTVIKKVGRDYYSTEITTFTNHSELIYFKKNSKTEYWKFYKD